MTTLLPVVCALLLLCPLLKVSAHGTDKWTSRWNQAWHDAHGGKGPLSDDTVASGKGYADLAQLATKLMEELEKVNSIAQTMLDRKGRSEEDEIEAYALHKALGFGLIDLGEARSCAPCARCEIGRIGEPLGCPSSSGGVVQGIHCRDELELG